MLEKAKGHVPTNGHGAPPLALAGADAQAIMACISAGFERIDKSLEKLAKAVK